MGGPYQRCAKQGWFFWATQLEHCDSLIYPLQVGWKHIRTTSFLANSPTVAVFHALGKTQLYTRLIARRSITLSPSSSYESTKLPAYQTRIYKGDGQTVKLLGSGQRDCLENSRGKVFACSKECPGDEAQGMSHGFLVIQTQVRTTCVPTAVESQTRLSVWRSKRCCVAKA